MQKTLLELSPALKEKKTIQSLIIPILDIPGIVLQGGGALHHIYKSPRLSADLDYTINTLPLPNKFQQAAAAVASKTGLESEVSIKEKLARMKFYKQFNPMQRLTVLVEIYQVHSYDFHSVKFNNTEILVESPLEILADKYVANIDRIQNRGSIKLRDLFDIWYIIDVLHQDFRDIGKLIDAKLTDYSIENKNPETVLSFIESLNIDLLRESLAGYLPYPADFSKIISASKKLYGK